MPFVNRPCFMPSLKTPADRISNSLPHTDSHPTKRPPFKFKVAGRCKEVFYELDPDESWASEATAKVEPLLTRPEASRRQRFRPLKSKGLRLSGHGAIGANKLGKVIIYPAFAYYFSPKKRQRKAYKKFEQRMSDKLKNGENGQRERDKVDEALSFKLRGHPLSETK